MKENYWADDDDDADVAAAAADDNDKKKPNDVTKIDWLVKSQRLL